MSFRTLAFLLPLALAATGCWTEACTYNDPGPRAACAEQLTGLLFLGDEGTVDWCGGDHHPFQRCADLGFTEECGEWAYLPGSLGLQECRALR